jgi:formylmethanofuran dehydrogenase subunit E
MQKIKMLKCPACGEFTLHPKRKELGYHVCVNCSSTKPVVAITTVEGSGDHTWNDIIIMDQDKAASIARKEAEVMGRKVDIELINFDKDDVAISQSLKERVQQVLDDDEDDTLDMFDPDKKTPRIQGIDY